MIVYSSEKKFESYWNYLVDKNEIIPPFYSFNSQNFYAQRPLDEGKILKDKSFILIWENEPMITFRGATVENNGKIDLIAYEIPCISIENKEKLTTSVGKKFLKEFDRISGEVNGLIRCRDFLIDGELSTLSRHLLSKGAIPIPKFSKVINLNKDELTLRSQIRKSYGSLINWGLRELNPLIFDVSNITWQHMNEFRELHIREAGHETRSVESWRRQLDIVQANEAFVIFGYIDNHLVSAGFFMHNKSNCYYGVSASRRDMFEKPLFHALMWTAIIHAKKIGCHRFEVGEELFPNHLQDSLSGNKEMAISKFKTGFGGRTVCQLLLTQEIFQKI
ncbi:hypothetical protein ACFLSY_01025 [Bacteroidota bacterium]